MTTLITYLGTESYSADDLQPPIYVSAAHSYFTAEESPKARIGVGEHHTPTNFGYLTKKDYKLAVASSDLAVTLVALADALPSTEVLEAAKAIPTLFHVKPIEYFDTFVLKPDIRSKVEALLTLTHQLLIKATERGVRKIMLYSWNPGFIRHLQSLSIYADNKWRTPNDGPIPYVELWKEVYRLTTALTENGCVISYVASNQPYVPEQEENAEASEEDPDAVEVDKEDLSAGHSDSSLLGEEQAYSLCSIAMEMSKRGYIEPLFEYNDQVYWKVKDVKPDILSLKYIFFGRNPASTQLHMVSPGGKLAFIGRRLSQGAYAVVRMDQRDASLSNAIAYQRERTDLQGEAFALSIDKLYGFRFQVLYSHYKELAYIRQPGKLGIFAPDGSELIIHIDPPALAYRANNIFSELQCSLTDINDGTEFEVMDITDLFYESIEKKGLPSLKLKPSIHQTLRTVEVKGFPFKDKGSKEMAVKLMLGLDTPTRNALKRLESTLIKLSLTWTWISPTCFSVNTHVKTTDATMVWSNFYSNTFYL